jgi:uncharacterized protein (TIGR02391 family)
VNLETEIRSDLWQAVRRSYENSAWSNAMLDAIHFLSEAIRNRTGLQSDGTALAGQAFGGKTPKLRLNRLETESEQSIQNGVEQLLRGMYLALRNPRSHSRIEDSQVDANAVIVFINYLLGVIGHARAEFSLQETVTRVLETNFVPNERYAELLVAEIPSRQRLQVALTSYQQKTSADGKKLRYFFDAVLAQLAETEKADFFDAVSTELRELNDDEALKTIFKCIHPESWPRINEIARLRVENHVVESARDGRWNAPTRKCYSGWLATWATAFLPHFTLKDQMFSVIYNKLKSSDQEERDYIYEFFFSHLDEFLPSPPPLLQYLAVQRLNGGDQRFFDAMSLLFKWRDDWNNKVTEARKNFRATHPVLEDDEEVPF